MAATPADTMAMLEALLSRVTKLEDERAILDTLHRYNRAVDDGDDGDDAVWVELFTEDGTFLALDRAGAEILRIQGRAALVKYLRGFRANETRLTKHFVVAPVITIDGETAVVESYSFRLSERDDPGDSPFLLLMGRYREDMVKDAQGRWRLHQRLNITEAPREVSAVSRSARLASRDVSTI
jgi:hypothetical protein